ncbi:MAG: DNA repair protein [Peptococcaceae bacterium BRH_c8a]|nr:MAG: DNA repair protein [Peptococcaceae bacterium BRH_c8a]
MRSMWKGAVTFGLIYVPVKLYAATEKKDVKFNYLHKKCSTPVRYVRFCPYCDDEVEMGEIVRGFEYEKGRYITMTDEELAEVAGEKERSIEIVDFVDAGLIDPVYYDRSYYLAPGEGGTKVYALLKQAMEESGRAAVAHVAIRSRKSLCVIRPAGQALVMETMFYADEVRQVEKIEEIGAPAKVHENEIKMAVSLIDSLTVAFDPAKYKSEYREKLHEAIRAKIAGEAVVEKPAIPDTEKVVDLMSALKASIDLARDQRDKKPRTRKTTPQKRKAAADKK